MVDPKVTNQDSSYVEPALEVSGADPLSTEAPESPTTTICGCCFC
jgi:hypothetical protein